MCCYVVRLSKKLCDLLHTFHTTTKFLSTSADGYVELLAAYVHPYVHMYAYMLYNY